MNDTNWDSQNNSFASQFKAGGREEQDAPAGQDDAASFSERFLQSGQAASQGRDANGWDTNGEGAGHNDMPGAAAAAPDQYAQKPADPYSHQADQYPYQEPAYPPQTPEPGSTYGGNAHQANGEGYAYPSETDRPPLDYQQAQAPYGATANGYPPSGDLYQPQGNGGEPYTNGYGNAPAPFANGGEPYPNGQGDAPPSFANGDYEIHTEEKRASVSWRYLDLRNKKQTGDLYKKILFYNKKKSDKEKKEYKAINFVSSRKGEGVTTILANLLAYVENQRKNVLVIDANLQWPGLNAVFNVPNNTPGLSDVFNNQASLQSAIVQLSPSMAFLSAGSGRKGGTSLEQDHFADLLKFCRKSYDFIFIDCPPVLSSTDALSIAPAADLSFLVLQSAGVQRPVIERAKILLQNDECEIGGVILNRVQQVIPYWLYRFI